MQGCGVAMDADLGVAGSCALTEVPRTGCGGRTGVCRGGVGLACGGRSVGNWLTPGCHAIISTKTAAPFHPGRSGGPLGSPVTTPGSDWSPERLEQLSGTLRETQPRAVSLDPTDLHCPSSDPVALRGWGREGRCRATPLSPGTGLSWVALRPHSKQSAGIWVRRWVWDPRPSNCAPGAPFRKEIPRGHEHPRGSGGSCSRARQRTEHGQCLLRH